MLSDKRINHEIIYHLLILLLCLITPCLLLFLLRWILNHRFFIFNFLWIFDRCSWFSYKLFTFNIKITFLYFWCRIMEMSCFFHLNFRFLFLLFLVRWLFFNLRLRTNLILLCFVFISWFHNFLLFKAWDSLLLILIVLNFLLILVFKCF